MNNKGFTLIETLAVIFIVAIITITITKYMGTTLSLNRRTSYKIMLNNIVKSADTYLKECSNTKNCNLIWNNNKTSFPTKVLEENGYYTEIKSPIDNKYLGDCLMINVFRKGDSYQIELEDNC